MSPSFTRRGLGYRRDPIKQPGETPDRDADEVLKAAPPPPPSASNKSLIISVLDQGQLGSCVANAGMQSLRASQVRLGAVNPPLGSRLFGYYFARAFTHQTGEDSGTFLRYFYSAVNKLGFPPETAWTYSDDAVKFKTMPDSLAFRDAYDQHAPTIYRKIASTGTARITDVKRALAAGYCVTFGTSVSEDFCSNVLDPVAEDPPVDKQIAGGHALCIIGYDGNHFEIVNSWSTEWGYGGYVWFTAEYLMWEESNDFWMVEQAPKFSGAVT